jgi:AraC family transcriptional regulator of adaptative response/methylated-DNA-[protein]-cysteine methyltransferase
MRNSLATLEAPLEHVRALIERATEAPSLTALASAARLSPSHLQRAFRRRYGMSPAEYHRARRFGQFKNALRKGAAVADAVYDAGFGSGSRVYEHTNRLLGMTPASYRAGGAGADIHYTTTSTPLGQLLVAATAKGICAVTLGATDKELEQRLAEEFPQATRERVDNGREEWLDAVIARIASELGWSDREAPDLPPLDVAATAFQWRVWDALSRIPLARLAAATVLRCWCHAIASCAKTAHPAAGVGAWNESVRCSLKKNNSTVSANRNASAKLRRPRPKR